jgi:hypothetical protein
MGNKPDMKYIAGSGALVGRDSICSSIFFWNTPLKINQDDMPTVEKSAHLGILRSKSNQKNRKFTNRAEYNEG